MGTSNSEGKRKMTHENKVSFYSDFSELDKSKGLPCWTNTLHINGVGYSFKTKTQQSPEIEKAIVEILNTIGAK
jgi:hypothetical protein